MYIERYDNLLKRLRMGGLNPKFVAYDFENLNVSVSCIIEYTTEVSRRAVEKVMQTAAEDDKKAAYKEAYERRLFQSCVASMKAINALCEKYGIEKVFHKTGTRDEIDTAAIAFEMELFADGIAESKREQKKAAIKNIQDILGAE